MSAGLAASSLSYDARFSSSFKLSDSYDDAQKHFAKELTSNIVGGIGYFHGASLIDRNFAYEWDDDDDIDGGRGREPKPELTEERQLLTATPSRSFFPRGFYWQVSETLGVFAVKQADAEPCAGTRVFIYS